MKKTLAIVLALVMTVALFAACGSSAATEAGQTAQSAAQQATQQATAEKVEQAQDASKVEEAVEHDKPISVRVALTNSVAKFGPDMIINPYNCIVADGVYERLAETKQWGSDEFVGVLLKSWEPYNDEYSYHCELYDYIVDQEGNKFTANDVKWCIGMQVEANKTQAKKVENVEVTGDYTFDITFTEHYAGWFIEFCENLWFCTQAAFEKSQKDQSICAGTGPYKATDFISNSYLELEKSDFYWQTDDSLRAVTSSANVDKIRYDIVSEVTQMAVAISDNKTFQMAGFVNESLIPDALAAEGTNGMEVTMIKSTQTKIIGFNCTENSPCGNADLRRAICYALDNDLCVQMNYSGVAFVPETWGLPALRDWDDSWVGEDYYGYDLEKARDYLEKAGYDRNNAGIKLTYFGNQTGENQNNGMWIAGCLSQLGIEVELWLVESAAVNTYANDVTSGWDMKECGGTPQNKYNYLFLANHADATAHGGVSNWGDDSQELMDRVAKIKEGDMDEFKALRDELNEEAYEYYFLGRYFVVVHDENITNIVTNWRNSLCVPACTFSENYDHFVE